MLLVVDGTSAVCAAPDSAIEAGRRLYLEGVRASGATIAGRVQGDVELSGELVVCGTCHRRSGMGSSEGEQVIPAITGDILFQPLRLPTTGDPLAPQQRPAYTRESLKVAIRTGIDANGRALDPLMPRYALDDAELDLLIDYVKTLSTRPDPGVDEREIHFATIVAGPVAPERRQALVNVMQTYAGQKNTETRHETFRAEHAPWHKKWLFEPYRKWVIHTWELTGASETWPAQLEALYRQQPVFAVLSGVAEGAWEPIHRFCESTRLPCLFPTTDLPASEEEFYSVYLSRGMALEGELIGHHLREAGAGSETVLQVRRDGSRRARAAADALAGYVGGDVVRSRIVDATVDQLREPFWNALLKESVGRTLVLWMPTADLGGLWSAWHSQQGPQRVYLSTSLVGTDAAAVPPEFRERVFLVHRNELPNRLTRLLLRSTGWLRVKKIYAPKEREVQANAYFALKMAGDALMHMRGYFFRDYMLERIEHAVDSAPYTSVYPRVSLAPGQRFVAKGGYITRVSSSNRPTLVAVTDWVTP